MSARFQAAARRLPPGFTTRFAPAPTGFLHLGHVASALFVWGIARARGGRVLLRIEDHDRTRGRADYEQALLEDLDWLGFAPDAPPSRQSERGAVHAAALATLDAARLVYACDCSRAAIRDAGAPEAGDESRYLGTCRDRGLARTETSPLRVRLSPADVTFDDALLGAETQRPHLQCGDLLVRNRAGDWSYQFAVVADDLDQGVNVIIRGEDLHGSTGRQLQLAQLLGRTAAPAFLHHPLIKDPSGIKLSKSRDDTGVRELRARGLSAAQLRGTAAFAVGLLDRDRGLEMDDLAALFR